MLIVPDEPAPATTYYVSEDPQAGPSCKLTPKKDAIHYRKRHEDQTNDDIEGESIETARSICFPSSSSPPPAKGETPLPKAVQALRSRHARTRSASSAAGPIEKTLYSSPLRTRSSSTSTTELPFYKPHLMHTVAPSSATAPRARPILSLGKETEETIGAFSPTSCPRRHLHEILEASKPPSRLRFNSLRGFATRPKLPWAVDTNASSSSSGSTSGRSPSSSDSDDDQSHVSSLPSICRTPSSYSESDYFPTAPSSVGVVTPVHSNQNSPVIQHKPLAVRPKVTETRPILEALEDASKFRVRTACANCRRMGSNFPCCPRCGEMWCSRECRLQATGGKRHVCKRT